MVRVAVNRWLERETLAVSNAFITAEREFYYGGSDLALTYEKEMHRRALERRGAVAFPGDTVLPVTITATPTRSSGSVDLQLGVILTTQQ